MSLDQIISFLPEELETLVKLLKIHYALPLKYEVAGSAFELMFAEAMNGKRESRKLLFDVLRDDAGWSLKTSQVNAAKLIADADFEVVLQRCNIFSNKQLSTNTPPEELGKHITERFYRFYRDSIEKQKVSDPRAAFLPRSEAKPLPRRKKMGKAQLPLLPPPETEGHRFAIFQEKFRVYPAEDFLWTWANEARKSLMGRIDGRLVLRWYVSGTQLFGVFYVTSTAHMFTVPNKRLNINQMLDYVQRQTML